MIVDENKVTDTRLHSQMIHLKVVECVKPLINFPSITFNWELSTCFDKLEFCFFVIPFIEIFFVTQRRSI